MFAIIKTRAIPNKNNALLLLIRNILLGDITNTSDLDSTYFDPALSQVTAGSLGTPSWTQVWANHETPANITSCVLASNSYNSNKTNLLKLHVGTGNGYLQITTGTSQTNGVLANEVTVAAGVISAAAQLWYEYVSERTFTISASNHSLVISNMYATSYFTTPGESIFVAADLVKDQHARYNQEASMKLGYLGAANIQLHASYLYSAMDDIIRTSATIISPPNLVTQLSAIGHSRKANLQENLNLIIPIIVNRLEDGWLGEDLSAICNVYLSTTGTFMEHEVVNIGGTKFYAKNPSAIRTPATTTRYLIKE